MNTATSISRRGFAKVLGTSAAFAAFQPSVLQLITANSDASTVVRLSSNENPYGPSPAAIKAMTDGFSLAWRYPDEYEQPLVAGLAKLDGISNNQVMIGAGSGEILKVAAVAFTGPARKLVLASPTFEAIAAHAKTAQAEVTRIDLTSDYAHDLPKMLAAANGAGLIYICNPNNPTASITPKDQIRAFLSKVPAQTIVLVDEAYHHYVESSDYESVIPLLSEY